MLALPSAGDGVLIFDNTGFDKKGRCSAGVARQYTGTVGKVTNCHVTVMWHCPIVAYRFRAHTA
jgi:SRSO17 transposase